MANKKALTPEELLEKIEESKAQKAKIKNVEDENVVRMSNNRVLEIKPTKIKYFKNGDFAIYRVINNIGVGNVVEFKDGIELLYMFLSAVFDKPYKVVQVQDESGNYKEQKEFDKYITELVDDELTIGEMKQIISLALKVNGVDENFLTPLAETGSASTEE